MTWDAWTLLVVGLAVLSVARPFWAGLAQRQGRPALWRRLNLERAGGGAAMLTIAIYLVSEARNVIGRGYWDLVVLAVHTPFMRALPEVWVPALCWALLVVLGLRFIYQGARASAGPRDAKATLWAANEMVVWGALLWWGVYVPDTWPRSDLLNFALQGIYIGFLVGGCMRLLLAMLGVGDGDEAGLPPKAKHWLGRFRRY